MSLLERMTAVRDECKELLDAVNAGRDSVTLREANEVIRLARHAEGYLKGVRDRLA